MWPTFTVPASRVLGQYLLSEGVNEQSQSTGANPLLECWPPKVPARSAEALSSHNSGVVGVGVGLVGQEDKGAPFCISWCLSRCLLLF